MSITAADHKTSSDKHGAFAFGETNSNCVKRPRSGGCKSVVEDSASSCMNCSTDDFARCCNDHCFAPGDRLAVAARAQLFAHGRQKQTMCSARRTIVLSQHLLAASHVAAMISRSSDEWKEACTCSVWRVVLTVAQERTCRHASAPEQWTIRGS